MNKEKTTLTAAARGRRDASLASPSSVSLSVSCVILSRSLLSLFAACHHLVKEIFIIPERLAVRHHRLSGTLHQPPPKNWVRHKYRGQPKVALMPYVSSYHPTPPPPPPTHKHTHTNSADDGTEGKREAGGQAQDSKEYCSSDKDIVEVVRTEYVYTRPPPWSDVLPTIHIITPTYSRPVQKAELTRLANTFLHVPNLHWILVEDSQRRTPLVTRLLRETGLNYTHLNVETPRNYKLRGDTRDPRMPRGTMQRNLALRWLRETFNANSSQAGIVYFADDDNTYSLELFEEVSVAEAHVPNTQYFKYPPVRGATNGMTQPAYVRDCNEQLRTPDCLTRLDIAQKVGGP